MYSIFYTELFRADIKNVVNYIAADNIDKAVEFVDQIEAKISNLAAFPHLGKFIDKDYGIFIKDSRRLVHNNYIIYYSVSEQEKIIYLERLLHGARSENAPD